MTADSAHIRKQVAKGTAWYVAMRFAIRGLGIISTIILARLLVPDDFGLVALATIVSGLLEMVTAFGIEAALVSDQKADRAHYDTSWTLRLLKGGVVGVLLVIVASPAAAFFEQPYLEAPIYCLAAASLIQGFENIGTVEFLKQMKYDRDFVFLVTKKLVSFAVTVLAAVIWRNYWAFIAGIVAGKVTGVILSYAMSTYRPRLSVAKVGDIFDFSKWMWGREVLLYLSSEADKFLLGKLAGAPVLGLYKVAYEVGCTPTTEMALPVTRAMFPGLSKLSGNIEEFKRLLNDSIALSLFVGFPLATGLSLVADPLVNVVYGEKWLSAIPLVEIIAFYGLARIVGANYASAFLALRRPDVLTRVVIGMILIRVPIFWWAIAEYGVHGLAYALAGVGALQLIVTFAVFSYFSLVSFGKLMAELWRPLLSTMAMAGVLMVLVGPWASTFHPALQLLFSITMGVAVYAGALLLLWQVCGRPAGPEQLAIGFLQGRIFAKKRASMSAAESAPSD